MFYYLKEYPPQLFSTEEGQHYPLGCQAGIEYFSKMGSHGLGNLSEIDFAARKINNLGTYLRL
jgi:hypothetical protein